MQSEDEIAKLAKTLEEEMNYSSDNSSPKKGEESTIVHSLMREVENVKNRKTRWTEEETELLKQAVSLHGKDYESIAKMFDSRTTTAVKRKLEKLPKQSI